MTGHAKVSRGTKLLAALCHVCPFCLAAHQWANNAASKAFHRIQAICPSCGASEKVRHIQVAAEAPIDEPVAIKYA